MTLVVQPGPHQAWLENSSPSQKLRSSPQMRRSAVGVVMRSFVQSVSGIVPRLQIGSGILQIGQCRVVMMRVTRFAPPRVSMHFAH
jgi:hypothetical protein